MENRTLIEARLQNMQKVYTTLTEFIDELPSVIPQKTRQNIKDSILGDAELKALLEDTEKQRPPRIFLFGRTGCGKSSIVNALCSSYITEISDVESCTKETRTFTCVRDERVLLEIMDSRGTSESSDHAEEAESTLFKDVIEFDPDIALLILSCVHRDDMDTDMDLAIKLKKAYYETNLIELPLLIVLNKADAVPPVREVEPQSYSERKIHSISRITESCLQLQKELSLHAQGIIAVSSLIEWMQEDGTFLSAEEINQMAENERLKLVPGFDGRWKLQELVQLIEETMTDSDAKSGLRMALRLEEIIHNLAKHIVDIFSGIAGTVALTPIPVADLYVLLALQSVMVGIIAILSGREANLESAKEFILSLGGVGGAGLGFRLLAQQSSKLLNGLFPGAGSVISTTVAASGTKAIGNAAISYYLK